MIHALSAALFHFLWQGALLALLPALALMFRSPRIRYGAACAALFAMPVVFGVTLAISAPQPGLHLSVSPELHPSAASGSSSIAAASNFDFETSMRWFVPFWLAGVALFYLRTLASWMAVQKLRRASSVPAPEVWRDRLDALAERLGIHRAVALVGSHLVDVPVVAGFLRPVIFVPAALFAGMPVEQLEYLLIHELAHIGRFDYAVNLLQKAVEGLLFYHPAVWWVSRILRTERENCCDDAVIAMRGNAREYAWVLASLEQCRDTPALAASGGNLTERIGRLLNRPGRFTAAPALGLLTLAAVTALAVAAHAQAPATPYEKWLTEDVAYIITDAESKAFTALGTDEERTHFIEQFWLRRDPTPNTPVNEFKEEHYRRIAYVNQQFQGEIPGWKSDRGRIYITFGPPDEIDSHPDPQYWEMWSYRHLQGIGENITIRFEDPEHNGSYKMVGKPL